MSRRFNNGYYRLGEVLTIRSGSTPKKNNINYWKNGDVKWLTSSEIKPGVTKTKLKINTNFIKIKPFQKGNVILAMYGVTAGKVGYLGDDMYINQAICVFLNNQKIIKNMYLYYQLCHNAQKIKSLSVGSAQQNLSLTTIKNYLIFIPVLSVQQKIIDIIEPIEKLEHTFNKLNNIISNLEAFLFNSIYKSSNHITINKLIAISNVKVNSNELELRGVGYSGFVNKSNVNRSKLSKQILEDNFAIGLISKNIPIAFNWEKNKIGVSTAYYVFKPINNPMASWYIYYYLKNKNWKQFVKPTSRHGQAFEVNLFLNNIVKFVFDDYLAKRFNFIFEKIKCLKNKYNFLLNKIINAKQKLIRILII